MRDDRLPEGQGIAPDGTIFVGSGEGVVYAIGEAPAVGGTAGW